MTIDGTRLAQLHAEHVLPFELGMARYRTGPCPRPFDKLASEPIPKRPRHSYEQTTIATTTERAAVPPRGRRADALFAIANPGCAIYRIDLATPHARVRVRVLTAALLVVALRDDKAVVAREVSSPSSTCDTFIAAPGIDRIIIYCRATTGITLCVLDEREQAELDKSWE